MDPRVELFIGGVWTDITPDVLVRDEILITRGRADERSRVSFSRCNLTLNNATGKYSNRNPLSPYFGQIGRNTQLRSSQFAATDSFTRTVSNGWGTATTGQVWTVTGTASDYSVASNSGVVSLGSVNAAREAYLPTVSGKFYTVSATVAPGVVATGAPIQVDISLRRQDASNMYLYVLSFRTDGQVEPIVVTRVAGVNNSLGVGPAIPYTSASVVGAEVVVTGNRLLMKIWDTANPSSKSTASYPIPASDAAALGVPGSPGIRAILTTGNTNTLPVAVKVDDLIVRDARSTGEVSQWPQRWDVSGRDIYVPLEAAGIMRRLGQGARKLKTPIFREATNATNLPLLVAYWSCEDGSSSASAASALGGPAMTASTGVTFASNSTAFLGSAPLPVATAGGFTGAIPSWTFTGTLAFRGLYGIPVGGLIDTAVLADTFGTGVVRRWALRYRTGGNLSLHAYDQADTELATSGVLSLGAVNGHNVLIGWHVVQNGANIDWSVFTREVTPTGVVQFSASGSFLTLTLTPPNTLIIGNGGNLSNTVVGHFMVGNSSTLASGITTALNGNDGERAANRIARLCVEEGISYTFVGNAIDSAPMGPQPTGALLDLLNECADADGGILYEPRETFGLAYRTRTSLYNQTGLALDYTAGHLTPPLEPIDDDQAIKNDITASRPNGSSARVTLTTGPLSTQDPPNGIGTYEDPITVNVQTDAQLLDVAGWRLHTEAWDEARYPVVTVNLAGSAYAADASLTATAAGVELGGYFSIANPPSWLPPDAIELLAQGAQERLTPFEWVIKWNATPAGPYRVAVLDTPGNMGRLDQPGSTLTTGVNTTATALSATVPAANPLWTQSITDVPFEIGLAGERIRVDSVGNVINANPWMIVDASGWSGDGSTLAWSTAQQYNSAYGSLLVTPTAGALPAYARSTARVAGTATVQYQIGAWIRPTTAWASGFRVGVDWYTATVGGTYISTTFHGVAVVLTANTWTYVSGVVTAPATTGGGQLFVVESGTPAVTDTWFASGITYAFIGSFNTSPQTFTCTRSINGVVKSQLAGATIGLWHAPALAR